jgi:hypothetical protein
MIDLDVGNFSLVGVHAAGYHVCLVDIHSRFVDCRGILHKVLSLCLLD